MIDQLNYPTPYRKGITYELIIRGRIVVTKYTVVKSDTRNYTRLEILPDLFCNEQQGDDSNQATSLMLRTRSAAEITYNVSGGALNSTHSLTHSLSEAKMSDQCIITDRMVRPSTTGVFGEKIILGF